MKHAAVVFIICLVAGLGGCDDDDPYGPYWEHELVVPVFSVEQDNLSTSFVGRVYPVTRFVFGAQDGFTFTKPNAKLIVNADVVWAYAPVLVALYDGTAEEIGTDAALVTSWEVPFPEHGGKIAFDQSTPLGERTPLWAAVDFVDFSGECILQILGHD